MAGGHKRLHTSPHGQGGSVFDDKTQGQQLALYYKLVSFVWVSSCSCEFVDVEADESPKASGNQKQGALHL